MAMRKMRLVVPIVLAAKLTAACEMTPTLPTAELVPQSAPPAPTAPEGGWPDLSGVRTLTIRADPGCDAGKAEVLPDDTRSRTYTINVMQYGPRLRVEVTGGFEIRYGWFIGDIEPDQVRFNLAWYDVGNGPEPAILEWLEEHSTLAIKGTATASGPPDRLAGQFSGSLEIFYDHYLKGTPTNSCTSQHHEFVLSR